MKAYILKFHSSFHIAAGTAVDGPSETFIRSDTLFSSICSAAQKLYGKGLVEEFINDSKLKLSSAFPYYYDELFFPRPLNFFPSLSSYDFQKAFKKIRFVSAAHLLKLISKGKIDEKYFDKENATSFILNGCWLSKNKKSDGEKIFDTIEVPHIILDRASNATQIFYKTEVHFNKNAGLFFLADIEQSIRTKFDAVIQFLGDEGIGADRTIGKGLFELKEIKDVEVPNSSDADAFLLLSLYSPKKEEVEHILSEESFYEFETRKGWVSNNTLNRKSVRMLVEGSVIKTKNASAPEGELKVVLSQDDYPSELNYNIYRYGKALTIPITGGLNEVTC